MKLVGLITEYNPFHNGHKYHIEQALKTTDADGAVVVMSGNYVQRGTPAFMPKHLRAEMALRSGASIVLELPVHYATGSAEYFAHGAVALLDKLNCINTICFGCEYEDTTSLDKIAKILAQEPPAYKTALQNALKKGLSFPAAREEAFALYTNDYSLSKYLSEPNAILGIEYIKALYQLSSPMQWIAIKREGSHYHDRKLETPFASATALRQLFHMPQHDFHTFAHQINAHVPQDTFSLFAENYHIRYPIAPDDFSLLLKSKLLTQTAQSLFQYNDISKDLANRIMNSLNHYQYFEQFCELLKSKELTYTRINRALLHILLNIQKEDITLFSEHGTILYARVLGFCTQDTHILSHLSKQTKLPLLMKTTDMNTLDDVASKMWAQDLYASNLYESVITDKYANAFQNDCTHQILSIS